MTTRWLWVWVPMIWAGSAIGQSLPTGFMEEVLASGLSQPVGMDFLPDGRVVLVEQDTGNVRVYAAGAVGTLGQVSGLMVSYSRGLLSVAVDPQWPSRPFLYCFYAHAAPASMRITMYPVSGALGDPASTMLALGAPYDIVTDIPDQSPAHNAGTLRFGPDGMLYASFGEDNAPCDAQDPSIWKGKILRLDVSALPLSGTGPPAKALLIPPGNPFVGPDDNARLVWALGLRNPFSFHIDEVSGSLMIADVGPDAFDEIDHAPVGGMNFGWPWFEASAGYQTCSGNAPAAAGPAIAHAHGSGTVSLISLGFYRAQPGAQHCFGADYEGDYFYTGYFDGHLRRLHWDGSSWVSEAAAGQPGGVWGSGLSYIADAAVGPDGALYCLRRPPAGGGSLRRVRPETHQMVVTGGDGQAGNAGQPLPAPLVVTVLDGSGAPVVGLPVTFQLAAGSGVLGPQPVLTDAAGAAAASFVLGAADPTDPQVVAAAPGAPPQSFSIVWRGLSASYAASSSTLDLAVVHSEVQSPLTLAIDFPQPIPVTTPWGPIWTSILAPSPTAVALDGLGILGPANPLVTTGASSPTWSLTLPGLPPLGGVTLAFQAYAIDAQRWPAADAVLVSNPITLAIN